MSWLTIESDPAVFSALIKDLGVKDVDIVDILSIDAESLSAFSPNWGVIFLFKYQGNDGTKREEESHAATEHVWFAHQKIPNACGTQAILALLLNQHAEIELGPQLETFREFTASLPPDIRGDAVDGALFRDTHNQFSQSEMFHQDNDGSGTGEAPYHFISYCRIDDRLYELDGLQPGPIDHGHCEQSQFGIRLERVLQERISRHGSDIHFNLMGLTRDPLANGGHHLSETERLQEMERQDQRRRDVALKKHGFAGAIVEITRALLRGKSSTQLNEIISAGKQTASQRQQAGGTTNTGTRRY